MLQCSLPLAARIFPYLSVLFFFFFLKSKWLGDRMEVKLKEIVEKQCLFFFTLNPHIVTYY